jgi:hypothetical protein
MNTGEKNRKNFPEVNELTAMNTIPAIPKPTSTRLDNN